MRQQRRWRRTSSDTWWKEMKCAFPAPTAAMNWTYCFCTCYCNISALCLIMRVIDCYAYTGFYVHDIMYYVDALCLNLCRYLILVRRPCGRFIPSIPLLSFLSPPRLPLHFRLPLFPPLSPYPFPGFPLPSPCPPSPFLPLEVAPLKFSYRRSGEYYRKRELPQRGLGQSPGRNRIWCILALIYDIGWQQF